MGNLSRGVVLHAQDALAMVLHAQTALPAVQHAHEAQAMVLTLWCKYLYY